MGEREGGVRVAVISHRNHTPLSKGEEVR